MSLSSLQRASLGSHRWAALVQRNAVPLKDLDSTPRLPIVSSTPELWPHCYLGYLVPGGRFFVALSNIVNASATLSLWDLGLPAAMQQGDLSTREEVIPVLSAEVEVGATFQPLWAHRLNMVVAFESDGTINVAVSESAGETR